MTADDVRVARVYDDPDTTEGARVLVDRLWPRGVSKERAHLDLWLKDVAPSTGLRRWYHHDPSKYDEFASRYRAELDDRDHAPALHELRELLAKGPVTLLTASRRADISEAAVLRDVLLGSSG